MSLSLKKSLEVFINDIKNERFADAHEHLEDYWKSIKKSDHPLKNLCKGFINGATAFELFKRGKNDGAKRVWQTHLKYLYILQEDIQEYELFVEANNILQEYAEKYGL